MRKKAGDEALEDETVVQSATKSVQPTVTADGTYATQSAFTAGGEGGPGGLVTNAIRFCFLYKSKHTLICWCLIGEDATVFHSIQRSSSDSWTSGTTET